MIHNCRSRKPWLLYQGKDTLKWNGVQLGNCSQVDFNMNKEELKLKISAEQGHKSCKDPFSEDER